MPDQIGYRIDKYDFDSDYPDWECSWDYSGEGNDMNTYELIFPTIEQAENFLQGEIDSLFSWNNKRYQEYITEIKPAQDAEDELYKKRKEVLVDAGLWDDTFPFILVKRSMGPYSGYEGYQTIEPTKELIMAEIDKTYRVVKCEYETETMESYHDIETFSPTQLLVGPFNAS